MTSHVRIFSFQSLFFIISTALCVVFCGEAPVFSESDRLYLAENAYNDELYDIAEQHLVAFIENNPDSPQLSEAILLLGKTQYYRNQYDDASLHFAAVLSDDNDHLHDQALFYLTDIYFRLEQYADCFDYARQFLERFPQNSRSTRIAAWGGISAFYCGQYQAAKKLLNEVIASNPDSELDFAARFYNARTMIETGRFTDAVRSLQQQLEEYSASGNDAEILFRIGEALFYDASYRLAIENIDRALELDNDAVWHDRAGFFSAESYAQLGELDRAATLFEDWMRLYPDSPYRSQTALHYASVELKRGAYEHCAQLTDPLREILIDDDSRARAWYLFGLSNLRMGNIGVAENAFGEILKINPDTAMRADVYFGLGEIRLQQHQCKESILYFRQSILHAHNPAQYVQAYTAIGDAYCDAGEHENSIPQYMKAFECAETSDTADVPRILLKAGRAWLALGDYEQARQLFARIPADYPASALSDNALYNIGWAYFSESSFEQAVSVFDELIETYPDSTIIDYALFYRGYSAYAMNDMTKALDSYDRLIKLNTDSSLREKALYELGWCYFQLGQTDAAIRQFEACLLEYPRSLCAPDILFWFGSYYYNLGRYHKALTYFTRLMHSYPDAPMHLRSVFWAGRSAYLAQELDRAVEYLSKFITANPEHDLIVDALLTRAEVFVALNHYAEALKEVSTIISDYPHSYLLDSAYLLKGKIHYLLKDYAAAIEAYLKVTKSFDREFAAQAWYYIGKSHMNNADATKGLDALLRVVYQYSDQQKWFYQAAFDAGVYCQSENKLRQARKIFSRMVDAYDDPGQYGALIDQARQRLKSLGETQFMSFE